MQSEPTDAVDLDTLGLLAAIGIEKGKPFALDAREEDPDERGSGVLVERRFVRLARNQNEG